MSESKPVIEWSELQEHDYVAFRIGKNAWRLGEVAESDIIFIEPSHPANSGGHMCLLDENDEAYQQNEVDEIVLLERSESDGVV